MNPPYHLNPYDASIVQYRDPYASGPYPSDMIRLLTKLTRRVSELESNVQVLTSLLEENQSRLRELLLLPHKETQGGGGAVVVRM